MRYKTQELEGFSHLERSASNITILWTLCPDVNSISFNICIFNCCHEIMYLKEKCK